MMMSRKKSGAVHFLCIAPLVGSFLKLFGFCGSALHKVLLCWFLKENSIASVRGYIGSSGYRPGKIPGKEKTTPDNLRRCCMHILS